jgi:hypothetical protein
MPLAGTMSLALQLSLTKAFDMNIAPTALMNLSKGLTIATGTGAGQADLLFADTRTIAISGTDDLDLTGGGLLTPLGDAFNAARIKGLVVVAESHLSTDTVNTNDVVIGGAAATQWVGPFGAATHTIRLQPGMVFCIFATGATAWPVGAGASDLLRIANSGAGTSVIYQIAILGSSV